jgi:hypothetical protein
MRIPWRTGFDINPQLAGLAPIAAIVVGAVGVASNVRDANGDIRDGLLPWAVFVAMVCLAVCCLGVLSAHRSHTNRWVIVGGWWTVLALVGIGGFFLSIAIGSIFAIDEEDAGFLVWPPLLGMMFGIISIMPAMLALAVGATRAHVLPWFGTTALWVGAPVVPLAMVYGGLAEGTAETVGMSTLMAVFVGAWIVLGAALLRTDETRPAAQHVDTPGSQHTTAHMRASRNVHNAGSA